jgi:hypothetical protein
MDIQILKTNKISKKQINDFIEVQKKVFNSNYEFEKFKCKYINNIFGSSILSITYINQRPIAARAFWRNDLSGKKAFQPCDTAVLKQYRGRGIFTKMNQKILDFLEDKISIYNFPNDNSLPGYLKMGWEVSQKKRYKIFNPFKDRKEINSIEDNDYIKWLLSSTKLYDNNIFYTKTFGNSYLLKKHTANIYIIIGKINNELINNFQKIFFPILLTYSKKGYIGRGLVTVTKNISENIDIPIFKIDTLF